MLSCSLLVIARKKSEYAVAGLLGVVITQAIGYGLIFDLNFFLRNLSVIGGLLMVLSDSWVRKRFVPAGLPQIDEKDRKMYVQLAGRVLLIFLFIGFVFSGEWSFWRILVSFFGFVACVMVVVGFKAKWSAVLLVVILSVFNVLVNNFWTVCGRFLLVVEYCEVGCLLTPVLAASAPPAEGLCQVRLLPDPVHCVGALVSISADCAQSVNIYNRRTKLTYRVSLQWRSGPPGQHGTRSIKRRREEEGLLDTWEGKLRAYPLHKHKCSALFANSL